MAGSVQPLAVTKANKTKIYCALLKDGDRDIPAPVTVTLTAPAAKGATTLTVTSVTTKIYKGQYLLFEDSDEKVYIAQVNADYATGVSVTVASLPEGIPSAAAAAFPAPFKLRTSADVEGSTDVTTVSTFDHDISGDASPGATTYTISTDGEYSFYDPGYSTCVYAQNNSTEIAIIRELAPPSPAFTKGKVSQGSCLITGRSEPNPEGGNVSASVSFQFTSFKEIDPVPTA